MVAPVLTLRRAWEDHYRPFIEPEDAEQTIRCCESAVRAWERWGPAALDVRTARAQDWSEFKRTMLSAPRSPATVNHYLRDHRAILRFCAGEGVLSRVPEIRPVTEPEQVKWRPSLPEIGRLFSAVADAGVTWPLGPEGFAVDWWQTFIVWCYVGAFRHQEARRVRDVDCTPDGVELYAPKTKRLSFAPALPCVVRQVERMRRWQRPGNPFLMSCGNGHRQFDAARDLIGLAAGFAWRPHGLKRASVDAWFKVDPTAGTIVGHGRKSTAVRHYLDRKSYLMSLAHKLAIPPEFSGPERQLRLF